MKIRYLEDADKYRICKLSHQINNEHHQNEPAYFRKPLVEGAVCDSGYLGSDYKSEHSIAGWRL